MPTIYDTEPTVTINRQINLMLPVQIDGWLDPETDTLEIYHASINGCELPQGIVRYLKEEMRPDVKDEVL